MPFDATAGWEIRTESEWRDLMVASHDAERARLGLEPAVFESDTVIGLIFDSIARQLASLDEAVQAVWDSRSPINATGESLTDLAALSGIAGRLPATYSTVLVNFFGTIGTVVPAGLIVRDSLRQDWIVTADATLVDPGAVTVTLRSLEPGPFEAETGTVTAIQSPISGINSVTNIQPAVPGRTVETDAQLRARLTDLLYTGGSDTFGALRQAVLLVDDVQQAEVLTNRTNSTITLYGQTLSPHSLAVFVYPTLSAEQEATLADVIMAFAPAGIEQIGTSSATVAVPDTDPVEYFTDIKWTYQTAESVEVDVVVELEDGYELAQVTPEITQAVADYQAALLEQRLQARKVRRLRLLGLLNQIDGILAADVLLNNVDADVELDIDKYPSLTLDTITEGTP